MFVVSSQHGGRGGGSLPAWARGLPLSRTWDTVYLVPNGTAHGTHLVPAAPGMRYNGSGYC